MAWAVIGLPLTVCAQHHHHRHRRHAAPTPVDPAPAPDVSEARRHFEQGRALFDGGNFDAALAEFERSYQLMGDREERYILLFNVGQCHERLFRYDAALGYYRRYLEEGGPQARDRAMVDGTVRALEGLLATIRVRSNVPSAEVWVDDRLVGTSPGELHIPGGRHLVELRAPGFLPSRQEVQIPARTTQDLAFALEALHRRQGVHRAYFWSAAGVALASGIVGGIFGGLALDARGDVDTRLRDPVLRYEVSEQDQQDIRRTALTADLFYAGAALFGVGATVLFFLTDWRRGSDEAPGARASLGVAPLVLGPATGVQLMGAF